MMRLLLAGACALLLTGCGGDDDDTAGGESTPAPTPTETAPAGEATATPTATAAAEATPATPAEGIASKDGSLDGVPLRLEVVTLRRTGELAELELRMTNLRDPEDSDAGNFQVAGNFDGPEEAGGSSNLDGVYLVDPVNRKKYPVASDAEGICVCSTDLGSTFIEAGESTVLTATYAAPPADVTQVDVSVPKFGTFRDVPIG